MPVYIRFDGVDGSTRSGGASGGVWKTTNFLTSDPVARAGGGGHVKVFSGSGGPGTLGRDVIPVSRISIMLGGGGVEGHDPSAKSKVEQLIGQARSKGPSGKLYIATDAGVYQNASQFDGQGRLVVGTDQGVWGSGGVQEAANKMRSSNNLKQLGLGVHNSRTVEIIVTDQRGNVVGTHRLTDASISGSTGGTFTLTFNGQTTGGY